MPLSKLLCKVAIWKIHLTPKFRVQKCFRDKNRIESRSTGQGMPIFQGSTLQKDRLSEKREFNLLTGCKSWPIDTNGVNPAWIWWSDVNPDFFFIVLSESGNHLSNKNFLHHIYLLKENLSVQPIGSIQVLRQQKKMLQIIICLNGQKQIAQSQWECLIGYHKKGESHYMSCNMFHSSFEVIKHWL